MKSKFTKYQKIKDLSLNQVKKKLNLSNTEFYRLLCTWLNQDLINDKNKHFVELNEQMKKSLSEERRKLSDERFLNYKYLRQEDLSSEDIAATLDVAIEKIERFDKRWFGELKDKNYSLKEIQRETRLPDDTISTLEQAYLQRKKEMKNVENKRISNNVAYANYYLNKIEVDPEDFLIIDLEGIQQPDEILEIAVINLQGEVLMDTLVRPTHHISWHVTQLTGINDSMAAKGKGLYQILKQLKKIAERKILLSWATDYDKTLLDSAMQRTGIYIRFKLVDMQRIHAGILHQAQQLALYKAAHVEKESQSHRALDDCEMLLKVLNEDLEKREEKSES